MLGRNLPAYRVEATHEGVTVTRGSKVNTVRLGEKAWTIQMGITAKLKSLGSKFDIVDLLGMIDKGIASPKLKAGVPGQAMPMPYFDAVKKNAQDGTYDTVIYMEADRIYPLALKREGNMFTMKVSMFGPIQHFITQGMQECGATLTGVTGRSFTFNEEDANAFEKWLKAQRRPKTLSTKYLMPQAL